MHGAHFKGAILYRREWPLWNPKRAQGASPLTPHCQPLRKRYCTRCAKECVQFLIAAFDLICSLRPLPLCGGVTKASAFGDTAFLREKAVRKRARGKPLDPRTADVLMFYFISATVCQRLSSERFGALLFPLSRCCGAGTSCRSAAG